jgi:hypothetical protein
MKMSGGEKHIAERIATDPGFSHSAVCHDASLILASTNSTDRCLSCMCESESKKRFSALNVQFRVMQAALHRRQDQFVRYTLR